MITIEVHAGLGVVVSRFQGRVTDQEAIEAYSGLGSLRGFKPGMPEVADTRGADLRDLSAGGLEKIVAATETAHRGAAAQPKSAILTDQALAYGLARIYMVLAEQSPELVQIFRSAGEVADWLGVPELEDFLG